MGGFGFLLPINFCNMFKERDLAQMRMKGISLQLVDQQLAYFREGIRFVRLARPATVHDGIIQLDETVAVALAEAYDQARLSMVVVKFVPASGAATRMFKDLFAWREQLAGGTSVSELLSGDSSAATFFGRMKEFAFWEDLSLAMFKEDLDANHLLADRNYLPLLDFILFDYGLDYASLPKGLLAFHRYGNQSRTPFEEHLVEGALSIEGSAGEVRIHFTVSPDHLDKFRRLFGRVREPYAETYGVKPEVDFSQQKPSTDTIAVDLENKPFRELDGSLFFRPGGHGALIENLNDLDADLVFIKNIDNVVPDHRKEPTVLYKKALGGLLTGIQEQVHQWLSRLDAGNPEQKEYEKAVAFATGELNIDPDHFPADALNGAPVLKKLLNRPLRICGMVKNQGEPGGGPFWVKNHKTGKLSLQIVESSQIDMDDPEQAAVFKQSTHFNPVDLVCATRDYTGKSFDLSRFVDADTGFISNKSRDGRDLKALELPGLWNGGMADWITLFAEVPLITFNPVKVVSDLLRKEHQ